MKVIQSLFVILFLIGSLTLHAQSGTSYEMTIGLKTENEFKEIITFSNGDFATREIVFDYNTGKYEIVISRFSECLQLLWARKISAQGKLNFNAVSNSYNADFNATITGIELDGVLLAFSDINLAEECKLVKLDKWGNLLWSKKIDNGFKSSEIHSLNCKYLLNDGYIITGNIDSVYTSANGELRHNFFFINRIDKNGKLVWAKKYYDLGGSEGADIALTKDKAILILIKPNHTLLKTDSSGNQLWVLRDLTQNGAGSSYFQMRNMVIDKDDNIYLSGDYNYPVYIWSQNRRYTTSLIKLNKDLVWQWGYLYNESDFFNDSTKRGFVDRDHSLLFTKKNSLILTNIDKDYDNLYGFYPTLLIELDLNGEVVSAKSHQELHLSYFEIPHANYNHSRDVNITHDSGYIFTGATSNSYTKIVKTNQNGITACSNKDSSIVRTSFSANFSKLMAKEGIGLNISEIKINPIPFKYRKSVQCADRFYPDAYLGNDTVICTSQPYSLNVKQAVYTQYLWSTGDTTESIKITKSGKYWVNIKTGFCTVSDTVNILFFNQIQKLSKRTTFICRYDSVLVQSPKVNAAKFYWIKPDKSIFKQSDIWAKDSGTYYLMLEGNGNCLNIDTFRLQYYPLPKASAGPDTLLCYNQIYEMQGKGGITYKWIPAKYLSNDTIANPLAKAPSQQLYMLIVKNAFGCADTSQMWLKVKPKLEIKLQAVNNTICSGENVQLQAKASGGDSLHYTYKWQNTVSKDTAFNTTLHKSGWLKVILEDGCSEAAGDSIFITVKPRPIAAFYTDPKDTSFAENKIQFINQSQGAVTYNWNFGTAEESNLQNPTYIYTDTGKYFIILIATNTNGCSDTAFGNIYIGDKFRIFIPNAFTPDDDFNNDVFSVYGTGIRSYSYEIYNRWGERIFTSSAKNKLSWNGAIENRGEIAQMDVYFYVLKVTDIEGRSHYFNGIINLLK